MDKSSYNDDVFKKYTRYSNELSYYELRARSFLIKAAAWLAAGFLLRIKEQPNLDVLDWEVLVRGGAVMTGVFMTLWLSRFVFLYDKYTRDIESHLANVDTQEGPLGSSSKLLQSNIGRESLPYAGIAYALILGAATLLLSQMLLVLRGLTGT